MTEERVRPVSRGRASADGSRLSRGLRRRSAWKPVRVVLAASIALGVAVLLPLQGGVEEAYTRSVTTTRAWARRQDRMAGIATFAAIVRDVAQDAACLDRVQPDLERLERARAAVELEIRTIETDLRCDG